MSKRYVVTQGNTVQVGSLLFGAGALLPEMNPEATKPLIRDRIISEAGSFVLPTETTSDGAGRGRAKTSDQTLAAKDLAEMSLEQLNVIAHERGGAKFATKKEAIAWLTKDA